MTITSQLMQINALVGFLLPILIAKIIHCSWSENVKKALGVVICAVAALISAAAQNKLNWHDYAGSLIIIFTLTKTSYLSLWKNAVSNRGEPKAPADATS